jgi:hypothetical protein
MSSLNEELNRVMEIRFRGRGKWENIPTHQMLMSLIRERPRDLVKLCSLAAVNAYEENKDRITTSNFRAIFETYSQERLQDAMSEHQSELPNIRQLLMGMRPTKRQKTTALSYVFTTETLLQKLKYISQHTSTASFKFANGRNASPKELANFLYRINFITARKETPARLIRKSFEQQRFLADQFADFGFDWEIHPAYRWALQPELQGYDIFAHLDPTGIDSN